MSDGTIAYPWEDRIESEPWREEDKEEWDRLERLRYLGASGSRMTTNREKQDLMVHESYLTLDSCWLCGQKNAPYFAMGRATMSYPEREFHCVRCGVELEYVVPIVAVPKPWRWGRPDSVTPSTVIHHAELWQEHEVQKNLRPQSELMARKKPERKRPRGRGR